MDLFWVFLIIVFLIIVVRYSIKSSSKDRISEIEKRLDSFFPYLKEKTSEQTEKLGNLEDRINRFKKMTR